MMRKITVCLLLLYLVQILTCAFLINNFSKEYKLDSVTVRTSYGESAAITYIPVLGLLYVLLKTTVERLDCFIDLSIRSGHYHYHRKGIEPDIIWDEVILERQDGQVQLIQRSSSSERLIIVFPQDVFPAPECGWQPRQNDTRQ